MFAYCWRKLPLYAIWQRQMRRRNNTLRDPVLRTLCIFCFYGFVHALWAAGRRRLVIGCADCKRRIRAGILKFRASNAY